MATLASRFGISQESALARFVAKYEGLYREHFPALIEEIHGIAEGAGLSYPYAFFAAIRDGAHTGACSAFACGGKHTADGRVLIGQTKDTSAPLERFRIMRIAYNSGRKMLILNYPGWIGNFSLSSDGVCFTGNTLYTDPPEREGTPGSLLKRLIMEKPSVEAILESIKGMAFSGGSITIADRSGHAAQDHVDFPLSICRHPSPKDVDTTNAAFVADVTAQEMHVAIGNPCVAPFHKYSLAS